MGVVEALLEGPTILGLCTEVMLFLGAVWMAFFVGLIIGWSWKPGWANMRIGNLGCSGSKTFDSLVSSPRSGKMLSPMKCFGSDSCLTSFKAQWSSPESCNVNVAIVKKPAAAPPAASPSLVEDCSESQRDESLQLITENDLKELHQYVEMKDGGPPWVHMMDRYTSSMSYHAWRRDPKNGPPQYRTRTIFEDATPEIVRDFFWDDEFRSKWEDMLAHATTIDECLSTGNMVVQWIRKFPFFCSDREYIISRRIWECERTYYCVTKSVPCTSIPRRDKPRRVDLYYSSWCIRAVESRRNDGQLAACEVLLFHYEDMGIPYEIAKLGIRQGMWGAVKKVEPGLRAYQKLRASGAPMSRYAFMAQINTKVDPDFLHPIRLNDDDDNDDSAETDEAAVTNRSKGLKIPKFFIVGGVVALACSLDRGLITKAVIFNIMRRITNIGRRRRSNDRD